ncbi:MAG: DUF2299 domain-containing protein [Deltaproteobacteria bacterium]|nr:DUF2299 domain-containing protein [Deltaproteobacteria bacterium]
MSYKTPEEAKEAVMQWLNENTHNIKLIEDPSSSFHLEIDYPLGTMKRQRVIQPKEYPGLCVLLNGVAIADEHMEKMKEMSEEDREKFYAEVRRDLIFLENSYDMNTDEQGIVRQVQFSYEFYFDSLTKTQLFKGLLLNHRTLLYIINVFNEKFGVPAMPEQPETAAPAQPVQ